MKRIVGLVLLSALLSVSGCGIWEDITGTGGSSTVTLAGEPGKSCSFDSECRSNSCVYPGICE